MQFFRLLWQGKWILDVLAYRAAQKVRNLKNIIPIALPVLILS